MSSWILFSIFLITTISANALQQPLFVSLGSHCRPVLMLQECGLRKAAFPFDWICSVDGERLLEIIEEDFLVFLNEKYLVVYEIGGGPLLHNYYHLEFLHEGDWREGRYAANLEKMRSKYQRRIERFRSLSDYKGKVFFIRQASTYSLEDPHRFFKFTHTLEIDEDFSLKLYQTLKKRFPKLDFGLIIINHQYENEEVFLEKQLTQDIYMIRTNPTLELSQMGSAFSRFFQKHFLLFD
ncbi:MAG: hypothetical protein HYX48_06520 [Chlamydiales bacterium]|nr:hypothetical protein [Chlamydiales bacterium]